jgi:plastocyanin
MKLGMGRAVLVALLALAATGCTEAQRAEIPVDLPFAGVSATVVAINIAFEPTTVTMQAGALLRIDLQNNDAGVPHNIRVAAGGREVATSEIITGVARAELPFGPLPPGVYEFSCEVHPNMTGTIRINP